MAIDIQEQRHEGVDLRERGQDAHGKTIFFDGRLYMQLLVYTGAHFNLLQVRSELEETDFCGVVYASLHDPNGVGLLTASEDPTFFVSELKDFLSHSMFDQLECRSDLTMVGRTYAIGYEQDLNETLIERPRRYVCNPAWPWAIWYPVRRSGEFEHITADQRRKILMEHGGIGMAYGRSDLAHDIRLACQGLDQNDNDFVIGILGKKLHPLSAIIERMRKTQQTSRYLTNLGPFFVGHVIWQSSHFE